MTPGKHGNGLKDQQADSNEQAKVGEFDKIADAKLEELVKSFEAEKEKYAAALPVYKQRRHEQRLQVNEILDGLKHSEPKWEDVRKFICAEVIEPVRRLKQDLDADLGPPQKNADTAAADLKIAAAQLEGWKAITDSVKKRLDEIDAWIKEICGLDKCQDRLLPHYIVRFQLLPSLEQLENGGTVEVDGCCPPPETHAVQLAGESWPIDPDAYEENLSAAWKAWRKAGRADAKAKAKLELITKKRADYDTASKPEEKRKAARAALRDYKPPGPPPPTSNERHREQREGA